MGEVKTIIFDRYCDLTDYILDSEIRLLEHIPHQLELRPLGKGTYGSVRKIKGKIEGKSLVVKIIPMDKTELTEEAMRHDFAISRKLGDAGIGVPVIDTYSHTVRMRLTRRDRRELQKEMNRSVIEDQQLRSGYLEYTEGYIIMEAGEPIEFEHKWSANEIKTVFEKIHRMCQLGIFCIDMKPANTVRYKNDIRLIDFSLDFCPYIREDEDFFYTRKYAVQNWRKFLEAYGKYAETGFRNVPIRERKSLYKLYQQMILYGNSPKDVHHWLYSVVYKMNEQNQGVSSKDEQNEDVSSELTDKQLFIETSSMISCYIFANMCHYVDFPIIYRNMRLPNKRRSEEPPAAAEANPPKRQKSELRF